MKIDPARSAAPAVAGRRADPAGGAGFALPADDARPAAAAAPMRGVMAVDAVLALQVDGAGRRQRQTRRAHATLDVLDRLQAGLLTGEAGNDDIAALAAHLADREPTGEAALDDVLREVDVRAAVELAKRQRGAGRA